MPRFNKFRTVALAASLLVLPISSFSPIHFDADPSFAGNGNGNGGGKGSGNGGGKREGIGQGNTNKPSQLRAERSNNKSLKSNIKSLKEQLFGKAKKTTIASAPVKKTKSETKIASKTLKQRKESQVAAVSDAKKTKSSKGSLASKLGALNAAHASAQAFANASPNSRVGLIRAYYEENDAALKAADAAAKLTAEFKNAKLAYSEALKLQTAVDESKGRIIELNKELATAQEKLDGLTPEEEAYAAAEQAVKDLNGQIEAAKLELADAEEKLSTVDLKALEEAAKTAETAAKEAAETAATAESDAVKALEAAANKPVTDEVRDALDKMLEGKIVLDETASVEDTSSEAVIIGDM